MKEVALFGNSLHLVAEARTRVGRGGAETRRGWPSRGFACEQIERIVPSLEDVFVSLIEARDRAEQPQEEVRR